jgi:hypothetical protein
MKMEKGTVPETFVTNIGIATGDGLDGREVGFRAPVGVRFFFSFLHVVQTGSGAHPASYRKDTERFFPGIKGPGRQTGHSPPTRYKVENTWIYTSTPSYVFVG